MWSATGAKWGADGVHLEGEEVSNSSLDECPWRLVHGPTWSGVWCVAVLVFHLPEAFVLSAWLAGQCWPMRCPTTCSRVGLRAFRSASLVKSCTTTRRLVLLGSH